MTVRWLVTGAAGFFGLHMVERLRRESVAVVALDVADARDEPVLRAPGVTYVRADVRDRAAVARAMAGVEVVVHAAAALPRAPSAEILSVSRDGTRCVYDAALAAGARRCIHIGTTAIYGVPATGGPLTTPAPRGAYADAKWQAELVGREARARGLDVTVLRAKTFIGPGRLGVFAILFDWVAAGKRIPILGRGDNRHQLLDVADLVTATWRAAATPLRGDEYDVGADRYGTVREDLGALFAHAATGARLRPVPAGPARAVLRVLDRTGLSPLYPWLVETAARDSFVDTAKIRRALDWRPVVSNAEALCASYDWYLAEGAALAARAGSGSGHRVAWPQGALRLLRWLS